MTAEAPVSQRGLSYDIRRRHRLELTSRELSTGLGDTQHNMIATALGQATSQDRNQLGLRIPIKSLGRFEDFGKDY